MINIKVELLFVDGATRELRFTPRRLSLTRTVLFLLTEALGPKTSRLREHNDRIMVIEVPSPRTYYPVASFTFEPEKIEEMVTLLQAVCLYGSIHNRTFTNKHTESSVLWPLFKERTLHLEKADLIFVLMYVSGIEELDLMLPLAEDSLETILSTLDTESLHTMNIDVPVTLNVESSRHELQ